MALILLFVTLFFKIIMKDPITVKVYFCHIFMVSGRESRGWRHRRFSSMTERLSNRQRVNDLGPA